MSQDPHRSRTRHTPPISYPDYLTYLADGSGRSRKLSDTTIFRTSVCTSDGFSRSADTIDMIADDDTGES